MRWTSRTVTVIIGMVMLFAGVTTGSDAPLLSLYPDTTLIHFGELDSCECVTGTEWVAQGVTFKSQYDLMGWMSNAGTNCPPSRQTLTTATDCGTCARNDDNDFVIEFDPAVRWMSVGIWDNDYNPADEYIAYILEDGDSISMQLKLGAAACVEHSSDEVLPDPSSPIVRVRINESTGEPVDAIAIDNVRFVVACADTLVVPDDVATVAGAIAEACSGTVVLVQPGTYDEYGIVMKNGVSLVGTAGATLTTIDGQGLGRVMTGTNLDSSTLITGLTITGGGIYLSGSVPVLEACIFDGNSASTGGGLQCSGGTPEISNCRFVSNVASQGGGAISLVSSSPTITGCAFESNDAHGGGGLWMQGSSPTISFCTFCGDSANLGGALQCDLGSVPTLSNCTIRGCMASGGGAGVHVREGSHATLGNTIIAFSPMGEAVHSDEVVPGTATLTCCDLFANAGGDWIGCVAAQFGTGGNIAEDPLFCNDGCEDFSLQCDSPCLDTGGCGSIGAQGLGCWFEVTSITDVGNDQGRQARITWHRICLDDADRDTTITSYSIWRRVDYFLLAGGQVPLAGPATNLGYPPGSWDYVTSLPACGEDEYSAVCPTLCDSTETEGICWATYFVRAHTANPLLFFDSDPDSGYSIDNLEPNVPEGLGGEGLGTVVHIYWDPSSEEDVRYYRVYRGADEDFDIAEALDMYPADDTTLVVGPLPDPCAVFYYRVTAIDFGGNESEPTNAIALCAQGASVDPRDRPGSFALFAAKPNPFARSTSVAFSLPRSEHVKLSVYDVNGRLVRALVDQEMDGGYHQAAWQGNDSQGRDAAVGVYFVRMEAGDFSAMGKVILLR